MRGTRGHELTARPHRRRRVVATLVVIGIGTLTLWPIIELHNEGWLATVIAIGGGAMAVAVFWLASQENA